MPKLRKEIIILFLIFIIISASGFQCKCASPSAKDALKPITLNYWRVWDSRADFEPIISAYIREHPNVKINYRKLRYEEYENELLEAWAEDRGPDIFSIHNTWGPKYIPKIEPLPPTIEIPFVYYKQAIPGCDRTQEQIIEVRKKNTIKVSDINKVFPQVVYNDIVFPDSDNKGRPRIFGIPLSIDTLTLFYNRDLLDNASIPTPPSDWDEFIENTRALTRLDAEQNITQSGAALGTFSNIERAIDIVSLLIMHNGENVNLIGSRGSDAGNVVEAIEFYLDFANPSREVYTWNNEMPNSLQAFMEGRLAFFFGYSYHIPVIRANAPSINFDVVQMPQINPAEPVNYANYWLETVSKKSKHKDVAWDFITFITDKKNVEKYLKNTGKPTALRSLIENQEEDPILGVFASQILTAKSWQRMSDFNYVEEIFEEMFEDIYENEMTVQTAYKIFLGKLGKQRVQFGLPSS